LHILPELLQKGVLETEGRLKFGADILGNPKVYIFFQHIIMVRERVKVSASRSLRNHADCSVITRLFDSNSSLRGRH
jgi:hypothetical protein